MFSSDLFWFSIILLAVQLAPGADMVWLTRTTLRRGPKAGYLAAIGIGCGLLIHGAVAVWAAQWILSFGGGEGHRLLELAGGLWLLWLSGLFAWRRRELGGERLSKSRPHRQVLAGLLCNLLNPKVPLFFVAILGPFLAGERPVSWPYILAILPALQGWLVWSLWVRLLSWGPLRNRAERVFSWVDPLLAVFLALFGIRLLLLALGR